MHDQNTETIIARPPSFEELATAIKVLQQPSTSLSQYVGQMITAGIMAIAGWMLYNASQTAQSLAGVQQSLNDARATAESTRTWVGTVSGRVDNLNIRVQVMDSKQAVDEERLRNLEERKHGQ